MRAQRGVSLIELILAVLLFALLLSTALFFMISAGRVLIRGTIRMDMQQQALTALNRLAREYSRSAPDGISICSTQAPLCIAINPVSQPDLRPSEQAPMQPGGNIVWCNFFLFYYFDEPAQELRRREWPPGDVAPVTGETGILNPRKLSTDRMHAILAGRAPYDRVLCKFVKQLKISYPPNGSDALLKQPVTVTISLERSGNTGHSEPETLTYQRTLYVRNQR